MTKIATREQKSHTLDNIVEHHHGRPVLASRKRFDSLQGEKVNLFCLALLSAIQNSFFPLFLFCHRTDAQGDVDVDCCVCIPIHFCHRCCTFIFVWHHVFCVCTFIRMSLSPLSCPPFILLHLFLSPHIHIWFLSVDCCI